MLSFICRSEPKLIIPTIITGHESKRVWGGAESAVGERRQYWGVSMIEVYNICI
jgi:hypothetical protein